MIAKQLESLILQNQILWFSTMQDNDFQKFETMIFQSTRR
jgi:hypothetical protein